MTLRRTLLRLLVPLALTAGLGSCSRYPSERVPPMKILVSDFVLPPGLKENPQAVRGWWVGARTIHQNPRAGAMFAERLSSHLAVFPWVKLFARADLKYYYARKRQLLREAFPNQADEELAGLMEKVPAIDFARDLAADKLLTGRVIENHLSENRTIHWWTSVAEFEIELIDVPSGKTEWKKRYRERRFAASQFSVQDEIAAKAAEDLKKRYFRPLAGE